MSDKHKQYLKKFIQKKSISFKHMSGQDEMVAEDEKYRHQNFAKFHKNKWNYQRDRDVRHIKLKAGEQRELARILQQINKLN